MFRFLHRPADSFEGVTRNFEQLEGALGWFSAHMTTGSATLTWAGGTPISGAITITVPNAHGSVVGNVTCGQISGSLDFAVPQLNDNGNGSATINAVTAGGSNPAAAATCTIYYFLRGA